MVLFTLPIVLLSFSLLQHYILIIGEHVLWWKRDLQVTDHVLLANAKLHTFFYISYVLTASDPTLLRGSS